MKAFLRFDCRPILYHPPNFTKLFQIQGNPLTSNLIFLLNFTYTENVVGVMMDQPLTTTEQKALSLLGQGLLPEIVASAIGVSPSRISQLLSQDSFAEKVIEARYQNLSKHTERDSKYDSLEDQLIGRLEDTISMLFDPLKISKILSQINAAKRRGQTVQELPQGQAAVVNLNMPTQIFQQFVTNINNQVVKAGQTDLVTIQSGHMTKLLENTGEQNGSQPLPARIERTLVSS